MAFLVDDKLLTLDLHGYGLSKYGFMFDESSLTFIDTGIYIYNERLV